jgi:hypothetical protein
MNTEQFNSLKEDYINSIKRYMTEEGELHPHISLFGEIKPESELYKKVEDEKKPALIHIPLSSEYMDSPESKERFVNKIFPQMANEIKQDFKVDAIAWATESWMRVVEKGQEVPENWREIPIKKEVVLITIEFKDSCESIIFDIKRDGKQITDSGELVDKIELTLCNDLNNSTNIGGRFSGLFKNFKDQ